MNRSRNFVNHRIPAVDVVYTSAKEGDLGNLPARLRARPIINFINGITAQLRAEQSRLKTNHPVKKSQSVGAIHPDIAKRYLVLQNTISVYDNIIGKITTGKLTDLAQIRDELLQPLEQDVSKREGCLGYLSIKIREFFNRVIKKTARDTSSAALGPRLYSYHGRTHDLYQSVRRKVEGPHWSTPVPKLGPTSG